MKRTIYIVVLIVVILFVLAVIFIPSLRTRLIGNFIKDIDFPDVENSNCGFYFREYGVCGGICPEGTCVEDEGSCYCKGY